MTKILGLDLGTNSIGWAIVDKTNQRIIDSGVRIFKEGVKADTIGKGDKEESKNSERRNKRQARRLHYRKRLRKFKLLELLISYEMCPNDLTLADIRKWRNWDKTTKTSGRKFPEKKEFMDWIRLNPYYLRKKALEQNITREEFGRILYHFIQRRGFLSSRKVKEDGKIFKGKENIEGVRSIKYLLNENTTLGTKLFEFHPKQKESYKQIKHDGKDIRIRARYTLREMYIDEFEKIWQKQAQNLKLDKETVTITKSFHLKGSPSNKRNSKKIEYLKKKYGKDQVFIEANQVKYNKDIPLKEHLAGTITHTEEGLSFKSNESVLFWQRQLRSQKGLLGKCTFENSKFFDKKKDKWITVGKSPAHISHPEYELFRAYQFVNNIRFGKTNTRLNDEQREKVIRLINKNEKNFTFEKIVKELNLTSELFNYDNKLAVPANKTICSLGKNFPEKYIKNNINDLWHNFSFFEDKKLLKEKLIKTYGLDEENAEKAASVKLTDGYASVSLKAIRNILPFLKKGYRYSTAVVLGGVKNTFGGRWENFKSAHEEIISDIARLVEKENNKEYELIEKVKEYLADKNNNLGFEKDDKSFKKLYHPTQDIEKPGLKDRLSEIENLRNPIVQKALHEMRRLINALLDHYQKDNNYGKDFNFDVIKVEIGRNLKNSKSKRQELQNKINENEKENDEARSRLAEYGLKPSRDNLTKLKLFREIEKKNGTVICPYTNKTVTIHQLLGDENLFQIEHIVPFSVSLDDSFGNKTICESNFNREKGELTPYEFYQKNSDKDLWGASSWEEIEQRAMKILPYIKFRKFTNKKSTEKSDFIQRQLNDMRYISRKAYEILSEISEDVRVLPGQLTAELRRLWGFNNITDPVFPLDLDNYQFDENKSMPHYLIIDKEGKPSQIIPQLNKKPEKEKNTILVPGYITKENKFHSDKNYRYLKIEINTNDLEAGKYWARLSVNQTNNLIPIFTEKPLSENQIIYRGKVENGKFTNTSIGKKITCDQENGIYWAAFPIIKKQFIHPDNTKTPQTKKNQILLYGLVKNGLFTSYIYECDTELDDGKYWLLIDADFSGIKYTRAINQPGKTDKNEYIFEGTVSEEQLFEADCDPDYNFSTSVKPGRYFAKLTLESTDKFFPIENAKPKPTKDQELMEGNIWVDKQTGEIRFDPKKNREDQRHHAIDAIAIALTERGFLQKLSTYYGGLKKWQRGEENKPVFEIPWPRLPEQVEHSVKNILVSYSQNRQILSTISQTVSKNGKQYYSVGKAARGSLHRDFIFGKHPSPILNAKNKQTGEILFEKDKNGETKFYYHKRIKISSIETLKHVKKIVDPAIRNMILKKLEDQYKKEEIEDAKFKIPAKFFIDEDNKPSLFLPNRKGDPVPVKKIRMKENIGNAVKLKDGTNQWVNPYNNHHIIIYRSYEGDLKESVVTFWDVVERKNQGSDVFQLPLDGKEIITILQENDYYIIGAHDNLRNRIMNDQNLEKNDISNYLYRVQKISTSYYTFRHHLASQITNKNEEITIQSFTAWEKLKPTKININIIGEISNLG